MKALILDCDGVLADTERDGHRVAFNRVFAENKVAFQWTDETYRQALQVGGGKERLRALLSREFLEQHELTNGIELETLIAAAERLFDTGGASATARTLNLDRHWRNARAIGSHSPLDYKAHAVGDYAVNGTPPPASGYF